MESRTPTKHHRLADKVIHYAEKCWAKANKKGNGGTRLNEDEALKLASAFVNKVKDKQLLKEWLRYYDGPDTSSIIVLNSEFQLEWKNRRKLDMSKRYQTTILNIYNAFVNGVERGGKIDSHCVVRVVTKMTPDPRYKRTVRYIGNTRIPLFRSLNSYLNKRSPRYGTHKGSARIYLDGVLTCILPTHIGNDSVIEFACSKALNHLGVISKNSLESLDTCLKRYNPASYHTERTNVHRKFVIAWGRNNFWDKLLRRV